MQSNTPSEESLCERISKRDKERKTIIEKRKEEKEQHAVETEQASYFIETFHSACKNIKDLLKTVETAPTASLPDIFTKINKEISLLQNYLFQSKIFLKVYDIRKASETLQLLENESAQLETKLIPRKKFGFTNRKVLKKATLTKGETSDMTDGLRGLKIGEELINVKEKKNNQIYKKYRDNTCSLTGNIDEQLVLDAENVNKNDVLLSDLKRCTVRIYGASNTLHMVNLENCIILVGPVTTSVFVDNCHDCQFAFACQQLRLHRSVNCTVYLHVTSRAIIEDSSNIYFAPYNWTYEDQVNHFKLAGLDPTVNNWNCVDDFNWPCADQSSPNWSVLEPESRVNSWG